MMLYNYKHHLILNVRLLKEEQDAEGIVVFNAGIVSSWASADRGRC